MLHSHDHLSETHLIGKHCHEKIVYPERCPTLSKLNIIAAGTSQIYPPYRMVRHAPAWSHIVACTGGRGSAWIAGKWVEWREGQVLLAPPGKFHAFEGFLKKPWHLAWIFYRERPGVPPLIRLNAPALVEAEVGPFNTTIRMLNAEVNGR
jgi:hypothetical protein